MYVAANDTVTRISVSDRDLCHFCSCENYKISSLRLAALRQSAAGPNGGGGPSTSAFAVYCSCTKQQRAQVASTDADGRVYLPSAAAADLMLAKRHYWSLVYYHQLISTLINRRYHRQSQKQCQQMSARRTPARVSTRSARYFSCNSCTYTTDRRNNLKRHVTTMHRAVTSFIPS